MPKIVVTKNRTTTPADTVAITEDTVPCTNPEKPPETQRSRRRAPTAINPYSHTSTATATGHATHCSAVTGDPALPFSNPDLLSDSGLVLTDQLSVSIQLFPRPIDISAPIFTTPDSNLDEFDDSSGCNAFPKRRLPSEHLISLANSAVKSAQQRQFIYQITNLPRTPAETLRNLNRSLTSGTKESLLERTADAFSDRSRSACCPLTVLRSCWQRDSCTRSARHRRRQISAGSASRCTTSHTQLKADILRKSNGTGATQECLAAPHVPWSLNCSDCLSSHFARTVTPGRPGLTQVAPFSFQQLTLDSAVTRSTPVATLE